LEHAQPVIVFTVDFDDPGIRADSLDSGHESLPLETIPVEVLGLYVRRGCQSHAALEQCSKEITENHRIGDIADGEFIEADDTRAHGDFVSDLIEGIWLLSESDEVYPVNIGNPSEMTIGQFAEKVVELTGSRSRITYHPLPEDDPKQRRPDISKARRLLGWEPEVQIEDGLRQTIDYFREIVAEGR